MDQEVITRRNLPHWYVPGAAHFVTYRLAGTIPVAVIAEMHWRREARKKGPVPAGLTPAKFRERLHKQFFGEYDRYLDTHREIDWLARPDVAAMIRENLYHHNGTKYHLLAYCVMPNHVHVLLQPIALPVEDTSWQLASTVTTEKETLGGEIPDALSPLAKIMHSLKSYTANQANALLGRSGQFWQHESYDHWIRDDDELERIVNYIIANPVKANLVFRPHEWLYGSAHDRFVVDGSTCGYLGDAQSKRPAYKGR